jgi:hypothetical protein
VGPLALRSTKEAARFRQQGPAGLAAAHAAFALHFWALRNHDKVFAAARDATENALAASDDPGLTDRLLHLAQD